jgi:hypothetical protein
MMKTLFVPVVLIVCVSACSKDSPSYNAASPGSVAPQARPAGAQVDGTVRAAGPRGQIATASWFTVTKQDCTLPCELAWTVSVVNAPRPFHFEAATHWSAVPGLPNTLENGQAWSPESGGKTSFAIGEGTGAAAPRYVYNTADHCGGTAQPDIDIVFDDAADLADAADVPWNKRWNIVGEVLPVPALASYVNGFITNITEFLPTIEPAFPGSISVDVRFVALNAPDRFVQLMWTGFPSGQAGVGPRETWEKRHWTVNAACDNVEQTYDFNWTPTPSEFGIGHLLVNGAHYTLTGIDNSFDKGKQTNGGAAR